ncbi:g5354 [Coccomyxa viridis]|uniref:G5354 protein n=1 Tax=Coccomyxa viridis TaxID=1274662 RepID=A0ABP1FV64_9CHLO
MEDVPATRAAMNAAILKAKQDTQLANLSERDARSIYEVALAHGDSIWPELQRLRRTMKTEEWQAHAPESDLAKLRPSESHRETRKTAEQLIKIAKEAIGEKMPQSSDPMAEPGYTAPISKDAEEHATTPMAITKAAMEAQLQEAKTAAERAQRSQRTAEADRDAGLARCGGRIWELGDRREMMETQKKNAQAAGIYDWSTPGQ